MATAMTDRDFAHAAMMLLLGLACLSVLYLFLTWAGWLPTRFAPGWVDCPPGTFVVGLARDGTSLGCAPLMEEARGSPLPRAHPD